MRRKQMQTLGQAGYTLLGWLDEAVTGDRKLLVVRNNHGVAEVWAEVDDTHYALLHDGKLYEYQRDALVSGHAAHNEVPPTYTPCDGCGKPRNPVDRIVGPVCGACTRKRHREAVAALGG